MIPTAIIAFREFLEAFLIVGVFLGVSKKLGLKKEKEIGIAALVGIIISVALSIGVYSFGNLARTVLTEENAELLANYLLIFSGCFLAYVVLSLHDMISRSKKEMIGKVSEMLQTARFNTTLFLTITFLVAREGFEIALFTASTSLFSVFFQNVIGLLIGLFSASILSTLTFFAYIKFPIKKVFRYTEYMIVLLGASMVQVGITELVEQQMHIRLGDMINFRFGFLPDENSIIGHLIRSFTGIDREFSLPRLAIMVVYIFIMFFLFSRKNMIPTKSSEKES